jgi:hypothetical protein
MLTQIFGWHGLPPSYREDGQVDWVHVPDETYENPYPKSDGGKPYHGAIHTDVEVLVSHFTTTRNGKLIVDTTVQHLTCNQCGAEQ